MSRGTPTFLSVEFHDMRGRVRFVRLYEYNGMIRDVLSVHFLR